jgi:hypothetical protein
MSRLLNLRPCLGINCTLRRGTNTRFRPGCFAVKGLSVISGLSQSLANYLLLLTGAILRLSDLTIWLLRVGLWRMPVGTNYH